MLLVVGVIGHGPETEIVIADAVGVLEGTVETTVTVTDAAGQEMLTTAAETEMIETRTAETADVIIVEVVTDIATEIMTGTAKRETEVAMTTGGGRGRHTHNTQTALSDIYLRRSISHICTYQRPGHGICPGNAHLGTEICPG